VLLAAGGEACIREVVQQIAQRETAFPNTKERTSVYTSLIQNHLPKLASAGLIDYDQYTDTLQLITLPTEYQYLLEIIEKGEVRAREQSTG
jgi:hypothetical protein